MFHKWLLLLRSAGDRWETISITFEFSTDFVWDLRKFRSLFSMSVEVAYFSLWRLFFVNFRQFIQRLMVIYCRLLLLKAWNWLILVLLRKINWVICGFIFLFWLSLRLLKFLLLFFLVNKQEILVCLTAYCTLLNLLALIYQIVVR